MMDRRFNINLLVRLALLFILVLLIGLAPRAYQITRSMGQARRAVENDSPRLAADHLEEAAERQPWRVDLWELAGHYALMAGEPERAINYLKIAETKSSKGLTLHARLDLGEGYIMVGDLATARSVLEETIRQYGPSLQASYRLSDLYRESGDYAAATGVLEQLSVSYPEDAELHFQLALMHAAVGDVEAAQSALERAAELEPGLEDAVEDLRGNIALARRQEDPAYAPLVICQGLAALEKWDLAAKACEEFCPELPPLCGGLGLFGADLPPVDTSGRWIC